MEDYTSLSGIGIRQVALLSDECRFTPAQSVVTPSGLGGGVIHQHESLISALQSDTLSSVGTTPVDFKANPFRNYIRELQKSATKTTLNVA